MDCFDQRVLAELAERDRRLITRAEVFGLGGTEAHIDRRLMTGRWQLVYDGVYLVGVGRLTWEEDVLAAVLASGPTAIASIRAAIVLWGLDGVARAPVEITVVHSTEAVIRGVVHRSRRLEPICWVSGVPTTSVERTLLESGQVVPPIVTEKAFTSAWRQHLTSPAKCLMYLEHHGGKGRTGVRRLREIAASYADGHRPPGSAAETDFFRLLAPALADFQLPPPIRQYEVRLGDGTVAVVDAAWPDRRKVVEVEGLQFHGNARATDYDIYRRTMLRRAGWDVHQVGAYALRHRPTQAIQHVLDFLGGFAGA